MDGGKRIVLPARGKYFSGTCFSPRSGLAAARRRFGVPRARMAIVGDQLFTDRLAASFFGIPPLGVSPRGGPARKDRCGQAVRVAVEVACKYFDLTAQELAGMPWRENVAGF